MSAVLPRVRWRLARPLPLAILRAALAISGALLGLSVPGPLGGILVGVALASAVLPRIAWAIVAAAAVAIAVRAPFALGAGLLLVVLGAHLVGALAELCARLPWRGRIELAALAVPLRPFLAAQLPAQAATGVLLAVSGRTPVLPLAAIAGALLLVALAVLLVRAPGRSS